MHSKRACFKSLHPMIKSVIFSILAAFALLIYVVV